VTATKNIPLRDAAHELAEAYGLRVFPCRARGKEPACEHGCNGATADHRAIDLLWASNRCYNIGLATGKQSGIWVLDVDGPDGDDSLAALVRKNGGLPSTVVAKTGKGRHFYFSYDSVEIRNSAGKLGRGLDTRGDGGYVLAPPSVHPSGAVYRWVDGHAPWERKIAEAPVWLIDLLSASRPKKNETAPAPTISDHSDAYGRAAIEAECRELAGCPGGARNHTLNKVAFRAGQLVGGGLLTESDARSAVLAAAQQCGLSDREAERTYDSGFKSGLQNPAEKKDRRGNVIPLDARSDRSDSLDDDGITADCTDLFSAETYIKYHGADTRYCDPLGKFLLWDGQRWARDKTGETESRMLKVARAELEIAAKRYKKLSAEFADVSADPNADTDVLQKIKAKIKGESSKLAWWKKSQNQNRYSSAVKTISIMREIGLSIKICG
jgi:hypothetical protein